MLTRNEEEKMPEITKIVLTGGPCAGKTTAMSWIQKAFTDLGYAVLFVAETATELISSGVAPWTCNTNLEYQSLQMKLQMEKEKIYAEAAEKMKAEKVLIVCDRGELDNLAYMHPEDFDRILQKNGWNLVQLRDTYDAVFHLTTAAKGASEFYSDATNRARTETPEQAIALDDRIIHAWTGHPHFRVIENTTDFHGKMHRLISEITVFLGEPEPYEIERKYLIQYPDLAMLENRPNCQKVEIIQTYLKTTPDKEIRIRQRGIDGHYTYYKTMKRKITSLKRVETEKRLTQTEYLQLLMEADTHLHQIRKTRYCLTCNGQYFEIDIYPFWNDKAIMEIELTDENAEIHFPEGIQIICDVTDDDAYKNSSLARMQEK